MRFSYWKRRSFRHVCVHDHETYALPTRASWKRRDMHTWMVVETRPSSSRPPLPVTHKKTGAPFGAVRIQGLLPLPAVQQAGVQPFRLGLNE